MEIDLDSSFDLKHVVPFNELQHLQKLEKIQAKFCEVIEEVFEALEQTKRGCNESQCVVKFPDLKEVHLEKLDSLKYIWKGNHWTTLKFSCLTRLYIKHCPNLKHVFTSSMIDSLLKLQELHVSDCQKMEVIVKEENVVVDEEEAFDGTMIIKKIILLNLKSVKLEGLPCLKGFFLGKEEFSWPSLDDLEIKECGAMTVFTEGNLATLKLKVIVTSFGMSSVTEGLNSFIKNQYKRELEFFNMEMQ